MQSTKWWSKNHDDQVSEGDTIRLYEGPRDQEGPRDHEAAEPLASGGVSRIDPDDSTESLASAERIKEPNDLIKSMILSDLT